MMEAAPKLPAAYNLVALESIDSTNAEAKRMAAQGPEKAPDGTVIWAREQTAGRGRRGREWSSPPGNLYFSLILRPDVTIQKAAEFSFIAALSLFDSLGTVGEPGHQVALKWPNDILLNDRKVAGILLETETGAGAVPEWIVLGVGINIGVFPADTEFPATSFRAEAWGAAEAETLVAFCRHFLLWSDKWLDEGFEPVRKTWLWRCYGKDKEIEVELENETITGIFTDLDEDGALLLETADGVRRITAGDVFFPKA
ncbi:MAG: biotin--[acetyl-CoA-carboxylase] ligase [Rhodospirillales bacterium]